MTTGSSREELAEALVRHAQEEGRVLARYRALAQRLGDTPAGLLVDMILTEEEMHHLLLRTTAKWLREPPSAAAVRLPDDERDEVLRQTKSLGAHERETIAACRDLRSRIPPGGERALLESVLDTMILDSEKHHRLLQAVEALLGG